MHHGLILGQTVPPHCTQYRVIHVKTLAGHALPMLVGLLLLSAQTACQP